MDAPFPYLALASPVGLVGKRQISVLFCGRMSVGRVAMVGCWKTEQKYEMNSVRRNAIGAK